LAGQSTIENKPEQKGDQKRKKMGRQLRGEKKGVQGNGGNRGNRTKFAEGGPEWDT